MNYKKIIHGYVEQIFNDAGECIEQRFVAGDEVKHETEDGEKLNSSDIDLPAAVYNAYFPFDMVRPRDLERLDKMEEELLKAVKDLDSIRDAMKKKK